MGRAPRAVAWRLAGLTGYTESCMVVDSMGIRVLERTVASQIAAGEVVERPASVVKELVENALDAGASRIAVEAADGGIGLIRVSDNGKGIPAEELETAFERFATSKVSAVADLEWIASLGFRGEALPSIAAVADVEVVTCTADSFVGATIALSQGRITDRGQQGRSPGTTVTARHLFRAVPARLKFLKSRGTESGRIVRAVGQYALAFPEVRFSLSINDRTVLETAGSGSLIDAVIAVHGAEVARGLLDIKPDAGGWPEGGTASLVRVDGMIGPATLTRANREHLSLFVNRRSISSRLLAWAVEEAYHGLLMRGRHPVAIISISLPPGEVDVNIHPAKAEVKFRDERAVFAAVQRAVRGTLVALTPAGRLEEPTATYSAPPQPSPSWAPSPARPTEASAPASTPLSGSAPLPLVRLPALRVLGQMASSYIAAEGPDGLYVIDQHAAHERILYEQYRRQQSGQRIEVQGLLEPAPFEVSPEEDEVLRSACGRLSDLGFDIEPFGERTYLVRAVPALLGDRAWADMVRDLLAAVASDEAASSGEAVAPGGEPDWTEAVAVSLACHGAVRAGKTLSDQEMRELVRQLEETGMPRSCPHGRPTVLHLGSRQLEREFGRS